MLISSTPAKDLPGKTSIGTQTTFEIPQSEEKVVKPKQLGLWIITGILCVTFITGTALSMTLFFLNFPLWICLTVVGIMALAGIILAFSGRVYIDCQKAKPLAQEAPSEQKLR